MNLVLLAMLCMMFPLETVFLSGKALPEGLTEQELRRRSHFPQKFYGKPHFMPEAAEGAVVARLNRKIGGAK